MSISDLIPNLRPMVESLNTQFRFICFFILTASIIVRTGKGSQSISNLLRPIVTAIGVCALIASLPFWFNLVRDTFWNIAVAIRRETTGSVDGVGASLMQLLQPPEDGINWLDVSNSLMKAVQYALGWIIVWLGCLIQVPMMLVQYVMECLCYLFLPIAVSLFAFDGTKGLATRYIQQTLAILAWPIGFAVVDLVGYALLTSVTSAVSAGAIVQGAATQFTPANMAIGGVVAVWLILGSLVTPVVMQMLFCSGVPLSSSIGQSVQMGLAVAGLSRMIAAGGVGGKSIASSSQSSSGPDAPPASSIASTTPPPRSPQPVDLQPAARFASQPETAPSSGGASGAKIPGVVQTSRGSFAVGRAADAITAQQAQGVANENGTPFTQAFSDGTVVTHQPQPPANPHAHSKLVSFLHSEPTTV